MRATHASWNILIIACMRGVGGIGRRDTCLFVDVANNFAGLHVASGGLVGILIQAVIGGCYLHKHGIAPFALLAWYSSAMLCSSFFRSLPSSAFAASSAFFPAMW